MQISVIRSVDVLIFLRYTPSKIKCIADAETTRGVGYNKYSGHKDNDRDATKISCRVSNDK